MKKNDYISKRFTKNPSIVSRKIADEFILVPVRQKAEELENIYIMNEVAGRIWELIDGKRLVTEIRDIIVEDFEVDRETAEADLEDFLRQVAEVGAVREV